MTAAVVGFECGSEIERARAAASRRACSDDHESVLARRRRRSVSAQLQQLCINIHSFPFPDGAVLGNLEKSPIHSVWFIRDTNILPIWMSHNFLQISHMTVPYLSLNLKWSGLEAVTVNQKFQYFLRDYAFPWACPSSWWIDPYGCSLSYTKMFNMSLMACLLYVNPRLRKPYWVYFAILLVDVEIF